MADEREPSATVDIKLRMKEPLRADIEATARERGVSMNSEMIRRLDRRAQQAGIALVEGLMRERDFLRSELAKVQSKLAELSAN